MEFGCLNMVRHGLSLSPVCYVLVLKLYLIFINFSHSALRFDLLKSPCVLKCM